MNRLTPERRHRPSAVSLIPWCLLTACGSIRASDPGGSSQAGEDGTAPEWEGGAGDVPDAGPVLDVANPVDQDPGPPPWETLIDPARLHQIRITVGAADVPTLETLHGADVPCVLLLDEVPLRCKGVHQKGSAYNGCRCLALPCQNQQCLGRGGDGKPAMVTKPGLSIDLDAVPSSDISSLSKITLQNGHQDVGFLSADLIYEVYRRAGLNAPHTAFAQVTINDIPQGLYIVEESKDKQFLRRSFGSGVGNVYEGSNVDFVIAPGGPTPSDGPTAQLDLKNEQSEMRTRDDLYALSNAILGAPDADFETTVSKLMDLDAFITAWAIDAVTDARDDYVLGLNNYYLYDNPIDNRFVLLPHGADEGFGLGYSATLSPYPTPRGYTYPLPDPWHEVSRGMLAAAVQDIPSLFAKYRAAVRRVSSKPVWDPDPKGWMMSRVARLATILLDAKTDGGRMDADILQFQKYRPQIERFIKTYGTARNREQQATWAPVPPAEHPTAVIVTSDLFYPYTESTSDDPLDLAILLSMPDVDVKGVVLENALRGADAQAAPQLARPGALVMGQIETVLRRRTPAYLGLQAPLASLTDQALTAGERFQGGVRFIVDTLKASGGPVTIVTLGGLRDVAAAFNRQPDLFREKVGRLLVFAGEAATTPAGMKNMDDYNVELDPFAFAAIMGSGLPVFWVPREDGGKDVLPGNGGASSVWGASNADIVAPLRGKANSPALSYLVNAFQIMPSDAPIIILFGGFGDTPADGVTATDVRAWSTGAALLAIADKTVTFDGTNVRLGDGLIQNPPNAVFGFSPVDVTVSERGYVTSYAPGAASKRVQRFKRLADATAYAKAMTLMTAKLFARFVDGAASPGL